jgi:hypothetical protein
LIRRALLGLVAAALAVVGVERAREIKRVQAQAVAAALAEIRGRFLTDEGAREILADLASATDIERSRLASWALRREDAEASSLVEPLDDTTKALLGGAHEQLQRDSLAYWMRHAVGMKVGPHHVEWSELLTEHTHLALLAARGHGKSSFWSYAFPLWRSWRDPHTLGLLISNTEGQVSTLMRLIKDGKSFTDEYGVEWTMPPAATIPCLAPLIPASWETTWTTERIWFENGSAFTAKTFGKSFRGAHVQWIVVDDPLRDNSQYSSVERKKSKDFLHRTVAKMLLPAAFAHLVVIGTPMHGDDLHADLATLSKRADDRGRERGDWLHRKYPGHRRTKSGRDVYLWPALRNEGWHRRERDGNALAYVQEVELRPVSDETSLFPRDLFSRHPETLNSLARLKPARADIAAAGWSVYIGVDLAISAEVGADFTVILVVGVDGHGNRHLIDLVRGKGWSFDEQLQRIKDAHASYGADLIFIESNQMQVLFAQQLARRTDLPVRPFRTGEEKHTLRRGVPSLRPLIENGKWRFPRGDALSVELTDVLLDELNDFGFVDGKVQGIGNHDDCVMAMWIADQAIRAGAEFGFSDGEDDLATAARRKEAEHMAALAQSGGPQDQLAALVEADRAAESAARSERRAAVVPRVNVHAVTWRHAAIIHPEGVDGVREAAAELPADREEHVRAWNALSVEPPRVVECDPAFGQIVLEQGIDITRAMLRDLLGL